MREQRDLGGAFREPGVAGFLRQVQISLAGDAQFAALSGNFGHQKLIQNLVSQRQLRQRSICEQLGRLGDNSGCGHGQGREAGGKTQAGGYEMMGNRAHGDSM